MVILYGSFLEPLIVMFSVPLAIIGALILFALMGSWSPNKGNRSTSSRCSASSCSSGWSQRTEFCSSTIRTRWCKRGMRVTDAVLQPQPTRFRPIIMTTAAMIFGMLPLALGFAEGGEWRQAMGTVIIGGLLSSLILTLFLVPMIYDTWMGFFERRGDRRAVAAELEGATATV